MDDLCEISIKNVCCTCLSTERNLSQLCRIDDGVNNLFFLLSYKSEAYEAVFVKDATQLSMCWECAATLQRLARFREQACVAQATLTDIADGKINYSKIKCLSKLSYSCQTELTVTQEAGIKVETPENFVDCGPEIVNMKAETPSDSDEVPLAQLHYLKREVAINDDEIDDNYDDYVMSDEDKIDSSVFRKSNNDKATVKNRDTATPIFQYGNNVFSSSINIKLEKPVDCFDIEKSKNIKRRHSLADIGDDKETDHKIIVKSEIEKSKSKRKLKSKNMAYNVNIPISSGEKNDKFNEKQKLVDGNIVSLMAKKSQSEKNEVRNRYLEPTVSHKKAAHDKSYECFNIVQMTKEEMVKIIEMKKLEDDYVNALNKCESCIETFEDCDSLEKHISELHELKPNHVLCNICKVYVKGENITTHNKVHYTKYVCRICNESLQYRIFCKKNVTDHLKTKHLMQESYIDQQMEKLKELEYIMLYSKLRQEPKYGAKLKVLIDDPQGAGFACVECKKYFKNKNVRNKHIQKFHREGYQCPFCGKKFPFSATLRRHELTHCDNPPPREQCSVCGKMVRADLVKAHAKTHASGKQYACVACDKKFMTRSNYEIHLKYTRSHADREGLKHKCSVCGKDYRSPGQLRDHYNFAHMGKTHHKCPICDKALATRSSVNKHVRRAHSGVKEKVRDHICQTCGKGFTHIKILKEHELIHTGERPLSCDICGRSFRQKACLYTHKRLVHKVALKKKKLVHTDEIIVPNSEINKSSD